MRFSGRLTSKPFNLVNISIMGAEAICLTNSLLLTLQHHIFKVFIKDDNMVIEEFQNKWRTPCKLYFLT